LIGYCIQERKKPGGETCRVEKEEKKKSRKHVGQKTIVQLHSTIEKKTKSDKSKLQKDNRVSRPTRDNGNLLQKTPRATRDLNITALPQRPDTPTHKRDNDQEVLAEATEREGGRPRSSEYNLDRGNLRGNWYHQT